MSAQMMVSLRVAALVAVGAVVGLATAWAGPSTANELLLTPDKYAGTEVTLDVAFVQPVKWESPVPELAFFWAATYDRREWKPGGTILVAIDPAEAEKVGDRYGVGLDRDRRTKSLKGTLVSVPAGGRSPGPVWAIDTTGKVEDLVAEKRLEIREFRGDRGGRDGAAAAE